jgi:hypothetical protein
MIISHHPASLRYGTDTTAQSVRGFMQASRPSLAAPAAQATTSRPSALDLPELYPSLFVMTAQRNERAGRVARAAVVRLSVLGTAAVMMLALFHR